MTEEERAKEYVVNNWEQFNWEQLFRGVHAKYAKHILQIFVKGLKEAFLAGLKAGRIDEQLTKANKELKDEYDKLLINYNALLKEYDELEDEAGQLRECY
jgi:hypothetical protein